MSTKGYIALAQEEGSLEAESAHRQVTGRTWRKVVVPALTLGLIVSLMLNLLSFARAFTAPSRGTGATDFAGLTFNTEHVIQYESRYNSANREEEDAAWASDLINPTNLVVALDDSFTESRGVLHSMRWPWDEKKGVYTLNSAHELHCLHLLRRTVNQAYDGVSPTWPRAHTAHCLEYLLQSILCYADDTPLYQGLLHQNRNAEHPIGGLGDTRKCRDWNQLQSWAREHSACYNQSYKLDDPTFPERERYKFCPDNRRPWDSQRS